MTARRVFMIGTLCGLVAVQSAAAYVNPGYFPVRNWSGYQVEADNVSMDQVSASWTQPTARCTSAIPYSVITPWIGIGAPIFGGTASSDRLEQIGADASCIKPPHKRTLHRDQGIWEYWPAPSHYINHPIAPGDRLSASVSIAGNELTMTLSDLTKHWNFTKRLTVRAPDERAAEWIVEDTALNPFPNQYSPLVGFSPVTFTGAHARSSTGASGTITSSPWAADRLAMIVGDPARLRAWPSTLSANGSEFRVTSGDWAIPAQPQPPPV